MVSEREYYDGKRKRYDMKIGKRDINARDRMIKKGKEGCTGIGTSW